MLDRLIFILCHVIDPVRQAHLKSPIGYELQNITKSVYSPDISSMFMKMHIMERSLCLYHCCIFNLLDSGSGEQSFIVAQSPECCQITLMTFLH